MCDRVPGSASPLTGAWIEGRVCQLSPRRSLFSVANASKWFACVVWNLISNYVHHFRTRTRTAQRCSMSAVPGPHISNRNNTTSTAIFFFWFPCPHHGLLSRKGGCLSLASLVGYRVCLMSEEPTVIGVPADSFNETPWCWFDVVLPRRPVCSLLRSIIGWGLDGLL